MTGPLVPLMFWNGSGSYDVPNLVPLGTFNDDDAFNEAAPLVADWVASRLGYPVMNVELVTKNIYACFEEAVREYSSVVNEFNMRDNMMILQGTPATGSISQQLVRGTALPIIIEMSEQYGTEFGAGGTVDYKRFAVICTSGQQEYDLTQLVEANVENGNRIEVRRVYNENIPAIQRFFDPFANSGFGTENFLGEFGWGGYSVATQFLLQPVYETLLRTQAIELNDQIRRSQYSFELRNNKLRIYPLPQCTFNLWIEYTVQKDKFAAVVGGSEFANTVSDFSNAPYGYIPYSTVNDVGRRWIEKYTLACAKETLGLIRSKYDSLPIPNSEVRMDGATLRSEAAQEKEILWTQLRESLEESGKAKQMEKNRANEESTNAILHFVPLLIYVG